MWSRVYETVRCPSVRLSVPSIDRCSSVRRFAAGRPAGGRYRLTAAGAQLQRRGRSTAHSNAAVASKREQCHVYSRRRRLNTVDLHSYMLSTVTEQFSVVCVHSKRITKYQYVQRGRPVYTRDVLRHCQHSMWSRVYETVRCQSVCPSMGLRQQIRLVGWLE